MFKALRLASLAIFALAAPLSAQDSPPEADGLRIVEITADNNPALNEFLWIARPLVVFADSPNDPRFIEQMEYIAARESDLIDRDVVVITDTDPGISSAIRETLRPRGFDFVLIGKDGQKYLRKPLPWDVREITRSIDKMPMRQQELRDLRATE
jgi:hypothetical protein